MTLKDSIRIMVIDDMSVSRALIAQALDEIGVRNYETEGNGQAALRRLAAQPAHLVLSDMNMPGLSGLDLLAELRANRATRAIGFILVTGTATPELVRRGQELGLNNLVKKPFTAASMRQSIERVVGPL